MNKQTLLIAALAAGGFLLWQNFSTKQTAAPTATEFQVRARADLGDIKTVKLKGADVSLASSGALLADWKLNDFRPNLKSEFKIDLSNHTHETGAVEFLFDSKDYEKLGKAPGIWSNVTETGATWTYKDANVVMQRDIAYSPQQSFIDVTWTLDWQTKTPPRYAYISIVSEAPPDDPESMDRAAGFWSGNSFESVLLKDGLSEPKNSIGPAKWVASTSRYFLLSVVSTGGAPNNSGAVGQMQSQGANRIRTSLVYPLNTAQNKISFRVYYGPKEISRLHEVEPSLDLTVDLGWFTFVAYPLLRLLKTFYSWFGNYGVAIIILTFLVKVVTLPLTYKSMKSMKLMAKFQPQIKKIQEKYKDDPTTMNREMLSFMKTHKYNPMAGCWPMLAQIPVFFALYRVLYSAVELYQAPFGLWIHDLSAKDPYYVLPALVSITWFIQQKISPQPTADPMQKKMMQFMPLMFGLFMISSPSGLGIYFLTNAVLGIIQQFILNKKFGMGPDSSGVITVK